MKTKEKSGIFLLLSLSIYTLLYLPFIGNIPYLDGNIDFIQTYDFFTGGFTKFFSNWGSVHPPFNFLLTNIAFLFGINPSIYTTLGLIEGLASILAIHYLTKNIIAKDTANLSSLLLAVCPLFIAVGIFALRDFLIIPLLLFSFYFYKKEKYVEYAITASAAILTKETMLLLPISIVLTELVTIKKEYPVKTSKKITKVTSLVLPLFIFIGWLQFLQINNQTPWHDWLFTKTASKGTIYTIIYNSITGNFLNKYAYQQITQLFTLNFNWVYWTISSIGILVYIKKKIYRQHALEKIKKKYNLAKGKTILAIIIFSITYMFFVLTIQTYTIPRYILPLIPFMLILTSSAVKYISLSFPKTKYVLTIILSTAITGSSFFSIDPISIKLWNTTDILGERLYNLPSSLAGNDRITYNMQYLLLTKHRTNLLLNSNTIQRKDCYWLFPDPKNDRQTLQIFKLKTATICL